MTVPYEDPKALEEYCLPFIRGEKQPATAEELMAARYVAYTLCEVDYILDTLDPSSREDSDRAATEQWARESEWQGLDVLSTDKGGPDDDTGEVEFVARFAIKGKDVRHHERSTFKKVDGKWLFQSGKQVTHQPIKRSAPKVGRNDPCSCGSGKKFKKCCGKAA